MTMNLDQKTLARLDQRLDARAREGRIACRAAQAVGDELGIAYRTVGRRCQEKNIKIVACQLGCF